MQGEDRMVMKRRKMTEVRDDNLLEEKKLRVEQVVTALNNADPKKKLNQNLSTEDMLPIKFQKGFLSACVENYGDFPKSVLIKNTTANDVSTNVTFALNQKVSEGEFKRVDTNSNRVTGSGDKKVSYYSQYSPDEINHPSLSIHTQNASPTLLLPVINAADDLIIPPTLPPFLPLRREEAGLLSKAKNTNIIRVPRDSKTPLIVFQPDPYRGNSLKKFLSPAVLPAREIVDSCEQKTASKLKTRWTTNTADVSHRARVQTTKTLKNETFYTKLIKVNDYEMMEYPDQLSLWTADDVRNYFMNTDCAEYADVFKAQEIDGKALCLLDDISISRLLDVKIGPAIKLSALIKGLISEMAD